LLWYISERKRELKKKKVDENFSTCLGLVENQCLTLKIKKLKTGVGCQDLLLLLFSFFLLFFFEKKNDSVKK
jgi:hypothetical protein